MPFEKGHPKYGGTAVVPQEVKDFAALAKAEARALLGSLASQPLSVIKAISKDPESSGLKHMLCAIILNAAKGNAAFANIAMDRLFGKVKEELEIKRPTPIVIDRSDFGGHTTIIGIAEEDENV